jgi:hypothetical protein
MDKWCWAASAQMIMRFLKGKQPEQCEMASFVTKQKHCCKDDNTSAYPYPARCDDTGWPPFAHYRYDSQQTKNTALTFVELQTQLSNNKPVAFSQRFIVSGDPVERGHMLVAIGYSVDSSGQWVEVNNPTYASRSFILYDTYVAIPGQTAHWNDYYDIAKRP